MKLLLVAPICLALAGCGEVAKVDARTEYQKSVADYRVCLDANPKDAHACDTKRLSMEAQEREYNNLALSKQGGSSPSTNIINTVVGH